MTQQEDKYWAYHGTFDGHLFCQLFKYEEEAYLEAYTDMMNNENLSFSLEHFLTHEFILPSFEGCHDEDGDFRPDNAFQSLSGADKRYVYWKVITDTDWYDAEIELVIVQ